MLTRNYLNNNINLFFELFIFIWNRRYSFLVILLKLDLLNLDWYENYLIIKISYFDIVL